MSLDRIIKFTGKPCRHFCYRGGRKAKNQTLGLYDVRRREILFYNQ